MTDSTANTKPLPVSHTLQRQLSQNSSEYAPLLTQIEQLYDQGRYTDAWRYLSHLAR